MFRHFCHPFLQEQEKEREREITRFSTLSCDPRGVIANYAPQSGGKKNERVRSWSYDPIIKPTQKIKSVGEHDIHYEPKSNKLKLLRKVVVQHGIKISFGGTSCVQTSPP